MPIIDHFSILAPFYERFIPLRNSEKFSQIVGLPIEGALLDAGGGTGRVAKSLRGLAGLIVVADLSMGMLNQIQSDEGLYPVNSHTERLPFPDDSFERVIMIDALHHVLNQSETAGELWRVIKPGGKIIVEEPDVRTFSVKLVALAEKLALMRSHFLSPPVIATLFDDAHARIKIEQDGLNAWVIIEKLLFAKT
jgi:ubiquinone/menaquinone biosynthesis C-methylase UbiE